MKINFIIPFIILSSSFMIHILVYVIQETSLLYPEYYQDLSQSVITSYFGQALLISTILYDLFITFAATVSRSKQTDRLMHANHNLPAEVIIK